MKKKTVILLVCIAVSVLGVATYCIVSGLYSKAADRSVPRILSDAFFITGGVLSGVGLISLSIHAGAFDINGRCSRLETGEKKEDPLRPALICGLVCLVCAVAMMFFA